MIEICGEICGDNRFEIINAAKKDLLGSTNINTSTDEMKVLDNFLFRCWQMGWLNKYEKGGEDGWYGRFHVSIDAEYIKPYLRSISSMTEEEVDTLFNVLKIDDKRGDWLKVNDIGIIRLFTEAGKDFYEIAAAFDYLNSIHIDYRGCIEKGLALVAPEDMYKDIVL